MCFVHVCVPLQVRALVVSCPAILAEKPLELQRKVDFLKQVRVLKGVDGAVLGGVRHV